MTKKVGRIPLGLCIAALVFTLTAAAQQGMPKTTKESIPGTATVRTETLHGTVVAVEGNHLAVRLANGGLRTFDPPPSRRFVVDGRELTVSELKPGTKLTATVTTTTTPVTDRTTTIGTGKVFFVNGNTVIVTLPNNENRMYKVNESYRFNVEGRAASVHELRKGMVISARKIVEEPRTEIASDTRVTGQAPPEPKPVVAEAPAPAYTPAPARPRPAEPPPAAAAPSPPPVHARAHAPAQPAEAPAELPATGSDLPLVGLAGVLFIGVSHVLRRLRQV